MQLEVLPAKKGDCLILHCGTANGAPLILIDGGPRGVWEGSLQPRLMQLRKERGLAEDEPLVISLLMVSHVDDDHIHGVIKLLEAMRDRQRDGGLPLFRIDRLWHNSFDDILDNDEVAELVKGSPIATASTDDGLAMVEAAEPGPQQDAAAVLASIKQGDTLRRLAKALDIPLNPEWDGKLIKTNAQGDPTKIDVEGIEFTVLGPHDAELRALQADHDKWLRENPRNRRTAEAFLAALDDKSVANLSSLVFLARSANGRTILLTGDALSDKVEAGLQLAGLTDNQDRLAVDILKMPHHGSIRNIDEHFIRSITADKYVFSANGEHSNPDRDTMEMLFKERPGAPMTFYFTYTIADLDRIRKAKSHGHWNAGKDSLAAVLSPPPQGVNVVEHTGAHMILQP